MSRIRKSGGYRKLASFQSATLVYDATYWFCEQFLDPRSRTVDQMVPAARSGVQGPRAGQPPHFQETPDKDGSFFMQVTVAVVREPTVFFASVAHCTCGVTTRRMV